MTIKYDTTVCNTCKGSGLVSRYVTTTQITGTISLRYTPRPVRICLCRRTNDG